MDSAELDKTFLTEKIKNLFTEEGFIKTGVSKIDELKKKKDYLKNWLDEKRNAGMEWLNNSFEKRTNPKLIGEEFISIISAAFIYDSPFRHLDEPGIGKISRYAWGNSDYHKVLKKKLKAICKKIESLSEEIKTKYCVDDGPVMDKVWAVKSGIGWMGKNTNVLNADFGSFFFLCEVFINRELVYDNPVEDLCESCNICLNACPTGALFEPYKLDANLCISYHTIENRKEIPEYINLNGWIFGCDICQDVCPYNKSKIFTEEKSFYLVEKVFNKPLDELEKITEEEFNEIFMSSPVKRTKYSGWKRNIEKAKSKMKDKNTKQ
jgi:epoxyqueuosine reductase